MFDIAWSEMIVIGAVALIAIGPKDLPKALRAVGAMTAKARRMASEFQDHFREAMREAELESVKEEVANINRDLSAATSGIQSEFNSIGSQMPAPSQPPLQLSGEATELDIPGLPELPVKAGDAATPPAGEPAAASGSPSSPDTPAHQEASAQPKAAEPAPAVTVSAQAQPGSVTVTETAVGETTAEPESKKPARKKRVVKPKPNGETQAEMPLEAAASNGSKPADAQASADEPSAKPARTKTPRKRAAKALPSGEDAAKALPSGDDQAA